MVRRHVELRSIEGDVALARTVFVHQSLELRKEFAGACLAFRPVLCLSVSDFLHIGHKGLQQTPHRSAPVGRHAHEVAQQHDQMHHAFEFLGRCGEKSVLDLFVILPENDHRHARIVRNVLHFEDGVARHECNASLFEMTILKIDAEIGFPFEQKQEPRLGRLVYFLFIEQRTVLQMPTYHQHGLLFCQDLSRTFRQTVEIYVIYRDLH